MDIYADLPSSKSKGDGTSGSSGSPGVTAGSNAGSSTTTPTTKGSWAHSKFQGMIAKRRTATAVSVLGSAMVRFLLVERACAMCSAVWGIAYAPLRAVPVLYRGGDADMFQAAVGTVTVCALRFVPYSRANYSVLLCVWYCAEGRVAQCASGMQRAVPTDCCPAGTARMGGLCVYRLGSVPTVMYYNILRCRV